MTDIGRRGACRACGAKFTVPAPDAPLEEVVENGKSTVTAAFKKSHLENPEELVDMTAMVDIVFFLLIFFLVTSITSLQSAIRMPSAEARQSSAGKMETAADYESNEDYVVVRIEPDDRMLVDDVEVASEQELRIKLREARARDNPPNGLLVIGDAEASHGAAVMVFDAASDVGMENVRLSVEDNS
jgi:biopolymer transport protein ExbD